MKILLLIGLFLIRNLVESKEIDLKHLRCLVCRATMKELEAEISKVNPNRLVEVGSYKMDAEGNTLYKKKVPLSQSEVYVSDVLDNICQKMKDYVRATKKYSDQLLILKLMSESGGMNPVVNKVDIIQDGDLNRTLEFYCSVIVEEFEEDIISLYVNDTVNKKEKLCTEISNICNENYIDDVGEDFDDPRLSEEEFVYKDKNEL